MESSRREYKQKGRKSRRVANKRGSIVSEPYIAEMWIRGLVTWRKCNGPVWPTVRRAVECPQHSPLIQIDIPATLFLMKGTRTSAVRRQGWNNAEIQCPFTSLSMILASTKAAVACERAQKSFSCENDTLRHQQRSPVLPDNQVFVVSLTPPSSPSRRL